MFYGGGSRFSVSAKPIDASLRLQDTRYSIRKRESDAARAAARACPCRCAVRVSRVPPTREPASAGILKNVHIISVREPFLYTLACHNDEQWILSRALARNLYLSHLGSASCPWPLRDCSYRLI